MIRFGLLLLVVAATLAKPSYDPIPPLLPGAIEEDYTSRFLPFKEITGRIINGSPASRGQFPWQAALYITVASGTSFCGGSLISATWILSAAHCTISARGVTAYLGVVSLSDTSGRVTATASRVVNHPSYSGSTLQNDISLLQLSSSVATSTNVRTIPLGSSSLGSGVTVSVSGWGRTSDSSSSISQTLNWVSLTTITNAVCAQTYGSIIQSGIVCARGATTQSTCNGDSGGPLITGSGTGATHVGIVSFGSSAGCARGFPTAYTRTASYRTWISSNAGV